jgi:hypothetical protein
MSIAWLRAKAPGFNNLSETECSAITDFSLLWSLFEARILDTNGSSNRIWTITGEWHRTGTLRAEVYDTELRYFRQRYFAGDNVTYHFYDLHLRENNRPALVRAVVDGTNNDPRDRVAAIFIIIFRYRNNLFHGIKWQDELAGQFDNFTHANNALMKALAQHGRLAEG